MIGESTTIWRCRTSRWQLRVDKWTEGDRVWHEANLIAVHEPLHRQRNMPAAVLRALTQAIGKAVACVNDAEFRRTVMENSPDVASFQRWQLISMEHPCFLVTIDALRLDDDSIRYILSIYDRDDQQLPVLSLTQGEQSEFLLALWEAEHVISLSTMRASVRIAA